MMEKLNTHGVTMTFGKHKGELLESGKIKYLGMKLVIKEGEEFPVLMTVMR